MSCRSSPSRNKNTLLNIYVSHLATIQIYIFFLKTQQKYRVLLADTRKNAPRDCHVGRCPPRNDAGVTPVLLSILVAIKVNEKIFEFTPKIPIALLKQFGGRRDISIRHPLPPKINFSTYTLAPPYKQLSTPPTPLPKTKKPASPEAKRVISNIM